MELSWKGVFKRRAVSFLDKALFEERHGSSKEVEGFPPSVHLALCEGITHRIKIEPRRRRRQFEVEPHVPERARLHLRCWRRHWWCQGLALRRRRDESQALLAALLAQALRAGDAVVLAVDGLVLPAAEAGHPHAAGLLLLLLLLVLHLSSHGGELRLRLRLLVVAQELRPNLRLAASHHASGGGLVGVWEEVLLGSAGRFREAEELGLELLEG